MNLGPESERPEKLKVFKNEKGKIEQKRIFLTDDEWRDYLRREQEHNNKMAELAKTQHLRDREEAYKQEIYPHMDNAKMLAELENDTTKMDELKAKKIEIDNRFPEPQGV